MRINAVNSTNYNNRTNNNPSFGTGFTPRAKELLISLCNVHNEEQSLLKLLNNKTEALLADGSDMIIDANKRDFIAYNPKIMNVCNQTTYKGGPAALVIGDLNDGRVMALIDHRENWLYRGLDNEDEQYRIHELVRDLGEVNQKDMFGDVSKRNLERFIKSLTPKLIKDLEISIMRDTCNIENILQKCIDKYKYDKSMRPAITEYLQKLRSCFNDKGLQKTYDKEVLIPSTKKLDEADSIIGERAKFLSI